ncbi:hypothetical protein ACFFQW_44500 [Umezawaea endophytica]|uniref:Uncharacterized protein n=1 Tax=Umezawaea endophytica TaxID=1654476 RepID=A0A9X2VZW5_9PSEU|nr:hypothetical protein [Umezawaea endophytica]MCS7484838.1 hypothetical protein [Umezawaea endophytica]
MPEQILEPDGTLWKPKPWATASAEEFSAARALIIRLNEERRWNPWVAEDSADDLAAADTVFDQWTRAEPDFRPLSDEEVDERLKTLDTRITARVARSKAERLARVAHFDEAQAAARLRLLEREAQLEHALNDRAALGSGDRAPAIEPSRRAAEIAELDTRIDQMRTDVDRLRVLVGDPESVVDEHGRLPADRRAITHMYFCIRREQEVRQLRASVSEIEQRLASKGLDKGDRATLRQKLASDSRQLTQLAAMPPLTEADMCSECVSPSSWHGYTAWGGDFRDIAPCPAWPDWAARLQKARAMLTVPAGKETVLTTTPRPQPLAVIPSGLPIAEVLQRLKDLEVEHPDAEVRRGDRNKWEIWPAAREDGK